jgi:hypothetical protein
MSWLITHTITAPFQNNSILNTGLIVTHNINAVTTGMEYRANDNEDATGTLNQRINYSSAMSIAVRPDIKDYNMLGIILKSYDASGFNIDSFGSGKFGYSSILNM